MLYVAKNDLKTIQCLLNVHIKRFKAHETVMSRLKPKSLIVSVCCLFCLSRLCGYLPRPDCVHLCLIIPAIPEYLSCVFTLLCQFVFVPCVKRSSDSLVSACLLVSNPARTLDPACACSLSDSLPLFLTAFLCTEPALQVKTVLVSSPCLGVLLLSPPACVTPVVTETIFF